MYTSVSASAFPHVPTRIPSPSMESKGAQAASLLGHDLSQCDAPAGVINGDARDMSPLSPSESESILRRRLLPSSTVASSSRADRIESTSPVINIAPIKAQLGIASQTWERLIVSATRMIHDTPGLPDESPNLRSERIAQTALILHSLQIVWKDHRWKVTTNLNSSQEKSFWTKLADDTNPIKDHLLLARGVLKVIEKNHLHFSFLRSEAKEKLLDEALQFFEQSAAYFIPDSQKGNVIAQVLILAFSFRREPERVALWNECLVKTPTGRASLAIMRGVWWMSIDRLMALIRYTIEQIDAALADKEDPPLPSSLRGGVELVIKALMQARETHFFHVQATCLLAMICADAPKMDIDGKTLSKTEQNSFVLNLFAELAHKNDPYGNAFIQDCIKKFEKHKLTHVCARIALDFQTHQRHPTPSALNEATARWNQYVQSGELPIEWD